MAETIALPTESREGSGKSEARALRRDGRVPAIVYGSDFAATPVHVDARELRQALSTDAGENAIIELTVGDDKQLTMPREIHRHPVRRDVLHLDFVAINRSVAVTVEVPLIVVGEGPAGSVLNQPLATLTIEVLPLEVPDEIEVSVEGMEVGDVLRVEDITPPSGAQILDDPSRTAVSVTLPSSSADESEEGEEGAEDGEESTEEAASE